MTRREAMERGRQQAIARAEARKGRQGARIDWIDHCEWKAEHRMVGHAIGKALAAGTGSIRVVEEDPDRDLVLFKLQGPGHTVFVRRRYYAE